MPAKKVGIERIKKEALQRGDICLSSIYVNHVTKLKFMCKSKRHIFWIDWHHYTRDKGSRCTKCTGNYRYTIKDIKKLTPLINDGYKCLDTEYKNGWSKLIFKCNKGHIFKMSWDNYKYHQQKCSECRRINMSGEKHFNWRNGVSFEPYPVIFNGRLKEKIKLRDNYFCQNPYCWNTAKRLSIHHIDYNKENCYPSNLITLCTSCNSRANKNRERWKNLYSSLNNDSNTKEIR